MADMRTWNSKKGSTIEAEYVNDVGGKVVLKGADGKQRKVPIAALSEKDQEYIYCLKPPKIDINVKKGLRRGDSGRDYDNKSQVVQCEVAIKKTGTRPYTGDLKAELFVFGVEVVSDMYVLMDKKNTSFKFTKENKGEHSFTGTRIDLEYDDNDTAQFGTKFEGFLVVVTDSVGEIIDVSSSRSLFTDNYRRIRKMNIGAKFDKKMYTPSKSNTRRF